MEFSPVQMESWSRAPYFDYYKNRIKCRYTLNANIDITNLLKERNARKLRFYTTLLYVSTRAVNENPQFRMAYDSDGQLGYWDELCPSYTIFHSDDQTFSDIWSPWNKNFSVFYEQVEEDLSLYQNVKGIKGKPGQPANTYPVSAAPWLSFTGYNIDTYEDSRMLVPILTYGKYFHQGETVQIPVALYADHAVADGYHSSRLLECIQQLVANPCEWIE